MKQQDTSPASDRHTRRAAAPQGSTHRSELAEPATINPAATNGNEHTRADEPAPVSDVRYHTLFGMVPVAVYSCDADGVISEYNQRAADLWGRAPRRGDPAERYCGSFKLFYPDDRAMPHDECPMARVLRGETLAERDMEMIVERPDGVRRTVLAHPQALTNAQGDITGAINCLYDITDRKQMEKALRASETQLAAELADMRQVQRISSQLIHEGDLDELYQQILDAAIAIMRSDMGSIQMLVPERNALRLLVSKGFAPASAAFWEWVRADSGSQCGVALAKGVRVIVPDVETCDFIVGSEELHFYRLSGIRAAQSTPLVARDGRVVGMISTHWRESHQPAERELRVLDVLARQAADLIERRQAEQASAHLAAIVTSADDAIASKTLDSVVTSWNASAERMFGYTAQEMIGQSILLIIPPDRHDEEDLILARIRAGQRIEHFETVRMRKDGRLIEVSLTISPIRDSAGAIIGASKIARDITERKRMEEARRESEEKFRAMADNIPTLAWMARPDGHIFWYNRRWYEYTGTTLEQMEGWGWQSVHDPDVLPLVMERWLESLSIGEPFEMVFPLRGADGVFRPFLTRIVPVKDERDRVVRWFGTNTDITEQRAAEEALRAANQAKDEFLGIASHELRTPLTSLQANIQIIERRLAQLASPAATASLNERPLSAATLRERLAPLTVLAERTERQMRRLNRLVGDLLDVTRIQSGKLDMRPEACDLAEIVREAVDEQRAAWPGRTITLDTARHRQIPLHADADRIGQVVTNYLTNALKYSAPDQPVAVRVRLADGQAWVEVQDQGPGLTAEQRAHLFERFYRVPGVMQQSGSGIGLGLGLSICKTIVERHGGQVGVTSAPGQGSTFWCTFPLDERPRGLGR